MPVERVVTFGPGRGLVGIWCEPSTPPTGEPLPTVVFLNSGLIHRAGIGRLHVRTARALAELGFTSLRFDLSGIGDSAKPRTVGSLADVVAADVDAALAFAAKRAPAEQVVLVGLCSGARDAFDAALRDPRVEGVVAIDMIGEFRNWQHSVVHYWRRALDAGSWKRAVTRGTARATRRLVGFAEPESQPAVPPGVVLGVRSRLPRDVMEAQLDTLLERRTRVFLAFSGSEFTQYNHRGQLAELFPRAAKDPALGWDYFPHADHVFSDSDQQAKLIASVLDWMAGSFIHDFRDGPERVRNAS